MLLIILNLKYMKEVGEGASIINWLKCIGKYRLRYEKVNENEEKENYF